MYDIFRALVKRFNARVPNFILKRVLDGRTRPRLVVEFTRRIIADEERREDASLVARHINETIKGRAPLVVDRELTDLAEICAAFRVRKHKMTDDEYCQGFLKPVVLSDYLNAVFSPLLVEGTREELIRPGAQKIGAALVYLRPDLVYCAVLID